MRFLYFLLACSAVIPGAALAADDHCRWVRKPSGLVLWCPTDPAEPTSIGTGGGKGTTFSFQDLDSLRQFLVERGSLVEGAFEVSPSHGFNPPDMTAQEAEAYRLEAERFRSFNEDLRAHNIIGLEAYRDGVAVYRDVITDYKSIAGHR